MDAEAKWYTVTARAKHSHVCPECEMIWPCWQDCGERDEKHPEAWAWPPGVLCMYCRNKQDREWSAG